MLGLAMAAVVLGGYFFTQWAAQPTWTPLYGNLSSTDAGSVTQELKSKGVQFKLADGGATVMVPQAQVYQLRLDMSAKNLPTGGSQGYALLDKQGITTSEFRQRVDYQRALEGELARTIGAIDGVAGADVHLVIPADLDFDQRSTTTESFAQPAAGQTSPLVKETTSQETFAGPGASTAAGGVLGTNGQTTTGNAASNANNYSKNSADRTFAVGKVTEQVKAAPGKVSHLSVA